MGILNGIAETGLSVVGLGGIFKRNTDPQGFDADFPSGLNIVEIVDGKERNKDKIQLVGSFMPFIPFEFGGKQQIVKDYYPGNPEPSMQILGPRENDVVIRGKLKTKRFKTNGNKAFEGARKAAQEYQELIDAMRRRGNLVKVTLGEWRRYAFIEECSFKLNRLCDIEYMINFSIVGLKFPTNCKLVKGLDDSLAAPNEEVKNAAAAALAGARNFPNSMPRTLAGFLDDVVSGVASIITGVTNFVDGAISDIENVAASANRAVGLIKNARANISRMSRRIGTIQLTIVNLSREVKAVETGSTADSFRTAAQFNNAAHIKKIISDYSNLALLLSRLQARFQTLAETVPLRRHLVKEGDTLQKLAIQYYNNSDLWKKIYDHNKLTTTTLVVGSVLEIPRS